MARTTSQGLFVLETGTLDTVLAQGVASPDSIDAALGRQALAADAAEDAAAAANAAAADAAEAAGLVTAPSEAVVDAHLGGPAADLLDGTGLVVSPRLPLVVRSRSGARPVGQNELAYSVKDQGAVGDGVADDTAAIQATLDLAAAGGSFLRAGRVVLPPGRYRITDTLEVSNSATVIEGAGWGAYTGSAVPAGTAIVWDGGNAPMIQVTGGRGFRLADLLLVGNKTASKRPTAGVLMYVGDTQTFKNGMATFDRVSFGKFSGLLGIGVADVVMDVGLLFAGVQDVQNDSSVAYQCRFDGCDVGVQTTGLQSVLHHLYDCYWGYCGVGVKTVCQMRVDNANFGHTTVRDFEVSGGRLTITEMGSEQGAQLAQLSNGGQLIINGGYWQLSDQLRDDRRIIDNLDDSNVVVRLRDLMLTANVSYATPALKPIIRVQPATNSANAQKLLELDNLRYAVSQPNTGVDESMLEVTPPAGSASSVTLFGNVQPVTPGGTSLNQGTNRFFHQVLRNGTAPDLLRHDRASSRVGVGRYRAVRGAVGTTRALTQNAEYCAPIAVAPGQTLDRVALNLSTAGSGGTLRFGVRQDEGGLPSATVTELGTVDASTTGIKEVTVSVVPTGPRLWLCVVGQGAAGLVAAGVNGPVEGIDLTSAPTAPLGAFTQTGVSGAFPTTAPTASAVGAAPLLAVRAS